MMMYQDALDMVQRLREEHPEGCSCGHPDCLCDPFQQDESLLTKSDDPYELHCAAIVRDQTDWPSPRCAEKRKFCRDHGIPCI